MVTVATEDQYGAMMARGCLLTTKMAFVATRLGIG